VIRVPIPSPPLQVPGGLGISYSKKAEALDDRLEAQFQPVNDPSDPAVEMVDEAMRASVCPRKGTDINQSLGGPTGHEGIQGRQGSGPERYTEHGPKTST
jgi:hypothetical protein